jgi:hypothetical protein
MKVKLVRDCWGPNPAFNSRRPLDRENNWPELVVSAGTEIEHPQAWMLCLDKGEFPAEAEPVDDEAVQRVALAKESQARQQADRSHALAEAQAANETAKKSRRQRVSPI